MTDDYAPSADDHCTFALGTVGTRGRDPFGHEVRPPLDRLVTGLLLGVR